MPLAVPSSSELRLLSSMATRRVLAELTKRFEAQSACRVVFESVGGVDVAKRVKAGEAVDAVVLAREVIDEMMRSGHITEGTRRDLVASPVAVAVRAGAGRPDISRVDGVKRAVLAARSVGYSTGPSGRYLAELFARWDDTGALTDRLTVAPAGVPVAALVARGDVELGFQQLSEMLGVEGIDVVGLLPSEIQVVTIFSGGVTRTSTQPQAALALLEFLAAPAAADIKRAHGMEPA
jgi:molybdate transport system substrate-binding protein